MAIWSKSLENDVSSRLITKCRADRAALGGLEQRFRDVFRNTSPRYLPRTARLVRIEGSRIARSEIWELA